MFVHFVFVNAMTYCFHGSRRIQLCGSQCDIKFTSQIESCQIEIGFVAITTIKVIKSTSLQFAIL